MLLLFNGLQYFNTVAKLLKYRNKIACIRAVLLFTLNCIFNDAKGKSTSLSESQRLHMVVFIRTKKLCKNDWTINSKLLFLHDAIHGIISKIISLNHIYYTLIPIILYKASIVMHQSVYDFAVKLTTCLIITENYNFQVHSSNIIIQTTDRNRKL